MAVDAKKSFTKIRDDYAFFLKHSTETANIERELITRLQGVKFDGNQPAILEFGSGEGELLENLVTKSSQFAHHELSIAVVEPEDTYREHARNRLGKYSATPVEAWKALPSVMTLAFNFILSNHVLYYVPDLKDTMRQLIASMATNGIFYATLANNDNALVQLWTSQFLSIGEEPPYNLPPDVRRVLDSLRVPFNEGLIHNELCFNDIEANRMKIANFLLGDHLPRMDKKTVLGFFDQFNTAGQIIMPCPDTIFCIGKPA